MKNAQELFNTKGASFTPELNGEIQPVLQIKPYCKIINVSRTTNGNTILFTTDPQLNTYIVAVTLSINQAVAGVTTPYAVWGCVTAGVVRNALFLRLPTGVATINSQVISFNYPLLVDKNSAIDITSGGMDANSSAEISVFYYLDG